MKKHLIAIAAATTLGLASQAASAKGWTFLAGVKDGYKAEPTLSVIGGISGNETATNPGYGGEFSLNCPLLQPPTNKIRQQVSYVMTPGDFDSATHNIELNPHYVVEVSKGLWIGGGPGLGMSVGTAPNIDAQTAFVAGLGASAHYEMGMLFVGAESRYMFNFDDSAGNGWRAMGKIGFNIR